MATINRVVHVGRLTRDPELRSTASGTSVCRLRLACNRTWRNKDTGDFDDRPNFFDVTVFGASGEACARFLGKGRPVAVDGRLEWHEWGRAPRGSSGSPSGSSPTASSSCPRGRAARTAIRRPRSRRRRRRRSRSEQPDRPLRRPACLCEPTAGGAVIRHAGPPPATASRTQHPFAKTHNLRPCRSLFSVVVLFRLGFTVVRTVTVGLDS